ncbi:AzlC family ABC transporter permease [Brevibacillus humidisoli]|uniref:AzlC family ABC transporter permease n=1 Tax=Brevibacillus humidisoli TaxID=2895522 RepID=UPI001E3CCF03|nr:AzlC family ABC transporter permease [Brevibacillus humidisoli]UFJ41025.1 AzlC family ABC transporter permease [Brevibacillus humidisoli]
MQISLFVRGMRDILPVAAAGIVDGLVFGILARQAGIGLMETMLFSLLINAGSAQFAAVGLVSQGIVGWPMLVSTLFLNARQLLYGLGLGPSFRDTAPWKLTLASAFLNDETYAQKTTYLLQGNTPSLAYFFGASFTDYLIWNGSTLLGAVFGTLIPEPEAYGLDFAFLATFVGFLAINLLSKLHVKVALAAGVVASLGYWWNGITAAVITGTVTAMAIGVMTDER